jgi:hypothetical protein
VAGDAQEVGAGGAGGLLRLIFRRKSASRLNLAVPNTRTTRMPWISSILDSYNLRPASQDAGRLMGVSGLIVAILIHIFWTNSQQFQGLAHQHRSIHASKHLAETRLKPTADMLRMGFHRQSSEQLPPVNDAAHQHAQTGYHLHWVALQDVLTNWLNPEAHSGFLLDMAQDNPGSQNLQLALIAGSYFFTVSIVPQMIAEFIVSDHEDAPQKRADRPPKRLIQGFKKPPQS